MRNKAVDARKLTYETLTELHKHGVAFIQDGQSPEVAAFVLSINRVTFMGVCRVTIMGIWPLLLPENVAGGNPNLIPRRSSGSKRLLPKRILCKSNSSLCSGLPK